MEETLMVRKVQAASGMIFAVFLAAHLVNTWVAVAGPGIYAAMQRTLSLGYQAPVLEWLILGSVLVHAGCAVIRWRRETRGKLPWRGRLHRYAGVFLLLVIGGHVTAVRLLPGYYGFQPGFEGVAFSLELLPGFFYPYYLLLGLAGAYHGLNGLILAAGRLGLRLQVPPRWVYAGAGAAAVLTVAALLAFGGVLFEVADPWQSDFARLYQRLLSG
jgi:succinate dehydrogenase/fumarate reductase cytochrome b subunit